MDLCNTVHGAEYTVMPSVFETHAVEVPCAVEVPVLRVCMTKHDR